MFTNVVQDVLALGTVGVAVSYLVFKLGISPALKSRRPDVPVSSLVRRGGASARPSASAGSKSSSGNCCH